MCPSILLLLFFNNFHYISLNLLQSHNKLTNCEKARRKLKKGRENIVKVKRESGKLKIQFHSEESNKNFCSKFIKFIKFICKKSCASYLPVP